MKHLFFLLLLALTWAITVYHLGVFPPPILENKTTFAATKSIDRWIDKSELGIHQLILDGTPYERGLASGRFTQKLLLAEEQTLVEGLNHIFPNQLIQRLFELGIIRWFWGIERYFEPWMVEEMYGVSKSAPSEFNYLADPLTRQVAYHGLHEVGQMMVDVGLEDFGCTVVAIPNGSSWIIGRNFDFEGGRIFDTEKIMKWVFPTEGYPFVSVIWAGMVGAVTAVNNQGVYLSINAAGSRDFRHYGTPSTLVLLKALQFSKNAEEALKVVSAAQMFITDIFVIGDRKGMLYRVEKSPLHTEVIPLRQASVITNHLMSPRWANDPINLYRKNELTSVVREARGFELLPSTEQAKNKVVAVQKILRDKHVPGGKLLHLGNRNAINALIATHAVIYDASKNELYVSQGPALVGPFLGFDLAASFHNRQPTLTSSLPQDPDLSPTTFEKLKQFNHHVSQAAQRIRKGDCSGAEQILTEASRHPFETSSYFQVLGDVEKCKNNAPAAHEAWKKALALSPAYQRDVNALEERLRP